MTDTTSTHQPRLTARQHKLIKLLDDIAWLNAKGVYPTKGQAITRDGARQLPTRTRANHYQLIDRLIQLGLVVDQGTHPAGYALVLTDAGAQEHAHWTAAK